MGIPKLSSLVARIASQIHEQKYPQFVPQDATVIIDEIQYSIPVSLPLADYPKAIKFILQYFLDERFNCKFIYVFGGLKKEQSSEVKNRSLDRYKNSRNSHVHNIRSMLIKSVIQQDQDLKNRFTLSKAICSNDLHIAALAKEEMDKGKNVFLVTSDTDFLVMPPIQNVIIFNVGWERPITPRLFWEIFCKIHNMKLNTALKNMATCFSYLKLYAHNIDHQRFEAEIVKVLSKDKENLKSLLLGKHMKEPSKEQEDKILAEVAELTQMYSTCDRNVQKELVGIDQARKLKFFKELYGAEAESMLHRANTQDGFNVFPDLVEPNGEKQFYVNRESIDEKFAQIYKIYASCFGRILKPEELVTIRYPSDKESPITAGKLGTKIKPTSFPAKLSSYPKWPTFFRLYSAGNLSIKNVLQLDQLQEVPISCKIFYSILKGLKLNIKNPSEKEILEVCSRSPVLVVQSASVLSAINTFSHGCLTPEIRYELLKLFDEINPKRGKTTVLSIRLYKPEDEERIGKLGSKDVNIEMESYTHNVTFTNPYDAFQAYVNLKPFGGCWFEPILF